MRADVSSTLDRDDEVLNGHAGSSTRCPNWHGESVRVCRPALPGPGIVADLVSSLFSPLAKSPSGGLQALVPSQSGSSQVPFHNLAESAGKARSNDCWRTNRLGECPSAAAFLECACDVLPGSCASALSCYLRRLRGMRRSPDGRGHRQATEACGGPCAGLARASRGRAVGIPPWIERRGQRTAARSTFLSAVRQVAVRPGTPSS